jgi:hypothetical protein
LDNLILKPYFNGISRRKCVTFSADKKLFFKTTFRRRGSGASVTNPFTPPPSVAVTTITPKNRTVAMLTGVGAHGHGVSFSQPHQGSVTLLTQSTPSSQLLNPFSASLSQASLETLGQVQKYYNYQ